MNFYVIDFCDVYTQQCGSSNFRNTPDLTKYPKIKKMHDVFVFVSSTHVSTFTEIGCDLKKLWDIKREKKNTINTINSY